MPLRPSRAHDREYEWRQAFGTWNHRCVLSRHELLKIHFLINLVFHIHVNGGMEPFAVLI